MILVEKYELKNTKATTELVNLVKLSLTLSCFWFYSRYLSDNPNLECDDKAFLSSFKGLKELSEV